MEVEKFLRSPTYNQFQANQELAQLFECPVCFDYVLPPIMQCNAGHLVCQNCQPKLTVRLANFDQFLKKLQHCPTCRGQAPTIRNLAMEKVAATVYFPCKYHTSGCHQSFLHDKKAAHEGFEPFLSVFQIFIQKHANIGRTTVPVRGRAASGREIQTESWITC